jgi:hypothetical protein
MKTFSAKTGVCQWTDRVGSCLIEHKCSLCLLELRQILSSALDYRSLGSPSWAPGLAPVLSQPLRY